MPLNVLNTPESTFGSLKKQHYRVRTYGQNCSETPIYWDDIWKSIAETAVINELFREEYAILYKRVVRILDRHNILRRADDPEYSGSNYFHTELDTWAVADGRIMRPAPETTLLHDKLVPEFDAWYEQYKSHKARLAKITLFLKTLLHWSDDIREVMMVLPPAINLTKPFAKELADIATLGMPEPSPEKAKQFIQKYDPYLVLIKQQLTRNLIGLHKAELGAANAASNVQ